MKDLQEEMVSAIDCMVDSILPAGEATRQDILRIISREELNALLFGWLAAKGLWSDNLDTAKFIDGLYK